MFEAFQAVHPHVQQPPRRGSSSRLSEKEAKTAEKNALVAENDRMRRDNEGMRREIESMRKEQQRTDSELQAARAQAEKLRTESVRLRSIFLGKAGTQKVTDDEVLQPFVKLRQAVQKLVSNQAYALTQDVVLSTNEAERGDMVEFYNTSGWDRLLLKDRKLRFRAKLFEFLHQDILATRCFGLNGFEMSDAEVEQVRMRRELRHSMGTIEPGLQRFERLLEEHESKLVQLLVQKEMAHTLTPLKLMRTLLRTGGSPRLSVSRCARLRNRQADAPRVTYSTSLPLLYQRT